MGHLWEREPLLTSAQAILACPFRKPKGTGWGHGHCFCLRGWEGTVLLPGGKPSG